MLRMRWWFRYRLLWLVFGSFGVSFCSEESVVDGEIWWPFHLGFGDGGWLVFDGSAGFDSDNTGVDVANIDGCGDPDHDLIGGVGAVEEQDFT